MEILIIGVLILLLIAGVFVHIHTVARYKHTHEQIQKDMKSTQGILDDCKKDLSLMEKELGGFATSNQLPLTNIMKC